VIFPPQRFSTVDKGHGRIETRTISVLESKPGQFSFPFVNQIFSVYRIFTDLNGEFLSSEICYGITSLRSNQAAPQRLLEYNRGHWCIENKVHYVRDVTMLEDYSRIRKGGGPRIMAIFKNIVLNILRSNGIKNIANAIQKFAYDKTALFMFAGLNGRMQQ
jgi:hypothetical protein